MNRTSLEYIYRFKSWLQFLTVTQLYIFSQIRAFIHFPFSRRNRHILAAIHWISTRYLRITAS